MSLFFSTLSLCHIGCYPDIFILPDTLTLLLWSNIEVKNIDILDVQERENPQIVATIVNTGNVPVAPERAALSLFDKYGEVRLGFAQNEDIPQVSPFSEERLIIEMPIGLTLGIGEYWAEATLYDGKKVIAETKTVFNVLEGGVPWWWYATGGLIFVVIVSIGAWGLRRRGV